ncbi:MAG: alpha/beta hydrolase [Chloroflexi bacterium]|nr:alpha/beta hydrolase [Chloroflexota bacterium]
MVTILLAHGAWSGGWSWANMRSRMRERGHEFLTPTYTGLGERAHLARPDVTLDTHIQDVLGVLEFEDLRDVLLLGHSYGGMVATGVADRARNRIAKLVYLDAFVPRDGQSLMDLLPGDGRARMEAAAQEVGEGWRIPSMPPPPDTPATYVEWSTSRRLMQPIETFRQPIRLSGDDVRLPRTYIYCQRSSPSDTFGQFARWAQSEPGWRYLEIDSSHSPHVTAPDTLANMLAEIASS